jgi:hypothetical protein
MGAGFIPAREKLCFGLGDPGVGLSRGLGFGNLGGIGRRTDNKKFIGADEGPLRRPAILNCLLFRRRGVHHNHIDGAIIQ